MSPPSTVELLSSLPLLYFGSSLPCEWKCFPTIRCPAEVPSVLPWERSQWRPPPHTDCSFQASCHIMNLFIFIISEMEEFTYQDHALSCADISKTWPDICSKLWSVCRLLNCPLAWIVPTQVIFFLLPPKSMILQSSCVKLGVLLNIKTDQHNDWFLSVFWTDSTKKWVWKCLSWPLSPT
jgi:hypothetical protein